MELIYCIIQQLNKSSSAAENRFGVWKFLTPKTFVTKNVTILELLSSYCMLQVQQVEMVTWRWWWRWLTSTRRRCGGKDERPVMDYYLDYLIWLWLTIHFPFVSWLWTEAGAQMELEASLGIGGFGYPAMAAINTRKMKFALLRGSFSETGIHEFLRWAGLLSDLYFLTITRIKSNDTHEVHLLFRELSVGRGSTDTFGGGAMPKIHSVEAWDGKDGQVSGSIAAVNSLSVL